MNILSLAAINNSSPYCVKQRDDRPYDFYFRTDYDVDYEISIRPDDTVMPFNTYMLDITNRGHAPAPGDPKFRYTLLAIIEEFFTQNNEVLLYITETGDGRQRFRNRLFISWFNTYSQRDRFIVRVAEGKMEGQENFMAIIARRDNQRLQQVIDGFDEITAMLFDDSF
ncbi:MAG: hypothetical protein IJ628_02210 [Bacteroidaceae bacterium]|nr:hypothetical protein [Bacteroidaceae bacterium]